MNCRARAASAILHALADAIRDVPRLPTRASLPAAILIAILVPESGFAQDRAHDEGAVRSVDAPTFALCRRNALLDFFVADLPPVTEAERATAITDIDADRVAITGESAYTLEGDVVARRADQRIAADRIDYDASSTDYTAKGNVRYQDPTLLLGADRASGNHQTEVTTLDNVRYQLLAERGNGVAATATVTGEDRTDLEAVSFSTCDPDLRDWEITARTMALDHATGEGRARGARLRFKGVTLLALPFASFPIDDRRRSGFLTPAISASNNGGVDFSVPYYLNLAPNYDATLVPRIVSDRGAMLGGEFRYLTPNHRGRLDANWMPDDREADRSRYLFRVEQASTLAPWLSFNADLSRISDPRYFEDFGDSLSVAATAFLYSSAYFNARGGNWWASFGGDDIEVTDPLLPRQFAPYRRLPRLVAGFDDALAGPVRARVDAEWVRFDRADSVTGRRADLWPSLAAPIERAGWFVRPELMYRHTAYRLDGNAPDRSLSRSLPIASLDSGLLFERPLGWFGESLRQTLEPRAFYLYAPFRDQTDFPVFDTAENTFSFAQLFRPTRFSGADRQNDANQLTLALTSRVLDDASGEERLRASIGQIRYFTEQRVQLPFVPASDFGRSAWAAELAFNLPQRWRVAIAQQYDPNFSRTTLSALTLQRRFAGDGVINFDYRYRRAQLEQVDFSTSYPVSERVRAVARWNWSLRDRRTLEAFAGLEYQSCCWALRGVMRHYVRNVQGDTANALFLELELKGLGSLGQSADDFLTQSIVGYRSAARPGGGGR